MCLPHPTTDRIEPPSEDQEHWPKHWRLAAAGISEHLDVLVSLEDLTSDRALLAAKRCSMELQSLLDYAARSVHGVLARKPLKPGGRVYFPICDKDQGWKEAYISVLPNVPTAHPVFDVMHVWQPCAHRGDGLAAIRTLANTVKHENFIVPTVSHSDWTEAVLPTGHVVGWRASAAPSPAAWIGDTPVEPISVSTVKHTHYTFGPLGPHASVRPVLRQSALLVHMILDDLVRACPELSPARDHIRGARGLRR